jgi:hypothetical protein
LRATGNDAVLVDTGETFERLAARREREAEPRLGDHELAPCLPPR